MSKLIDLGSYMYHVWYVIGIPQSKFM